MPAVASRPSRRETVADSQLTTTVFGPGIIASRRCMPARVSRLVQACTVLPFKRRAKTQQPPPQPPRRVAPGRSQRGRRRSGYSRQTSQLRRAYQGFQPLRLDLKVTVRPASAIFTR